MNRCRRVGAGEQSRRHLEGGKQNESKSLMKEARLHLRAWHSRSCIAGTQRSSFSKHRMRWREVEAPSSQFLGNNTARQFCCSLRLSRKNQLLLCRRAPILAWDLQNYRLPRPGFRGAGVRMDSHWELLTHSALSLNSSVRSWLGLVNCHCLPSHDETFSNENYLPGT